MPDHSEAIEIAKQCQTKPYPYAINTNTWLLAAAVIEMAGEIEELEKDRDRLHAGWTEQRQAYVEQGAELLECRNKARSRSEQP